MSKRSPLPRTPAIWRIVDKVSPIHQEERGTYAQIAVPNDAGRDFRGRAMPSFEKPYKLYQDVLLTNPKDLRQALHRWGLKHALKRHGERSEL
jgi:hypothetical protein